MINIYDRDKYNKKVKEKYDKIKMYYLSSYHILCLTRIVHYIRLYVKLLDNITLGYSVFNKIIQNNKITYVLSDI